MLRAYKTDAFVLSLALAALLLATPVARADDAGAVIDVQKLSSTDGNFIGTLDAEDGFGWSAASLGDIDGDGVGDIAIGAYKDDDGGSGRGAVYVCEMLADGRAKIAHKISSTAGGLGPLIEDEARFGWSVEGLGDMDGDGVPDMAVGMPLANDFGTQAGAILIVFLNSNGTVKSSQRISNSAGSLGQALPDFAWFGGSIANLGDLDGDGVTDISVGSFGDSDNGVFRGAIYTLLLNANGTVKSSTKINDITGGGPELFDGDEFGWSASPLGDLDGDGVPDVAVGAILDDESGFDHGAVYVLFLQADGSVKSTAKISGASEIQATFGNRDHFGRGIGTAGDINGDGITDLVVGASSDDDSGEDAGAVYVVFLDTAGGTRGHLKITSSQAGFPPAVSDFDLFGNAVEGLGDLDGDGSPDVIVGAPRDDDGLPDAGAAYVTFLQTGRFTNLGFGKEGTNGELLLTADGTLLPPDPITLTLAGALENDTAILIAGLAELGVPFKGGTMVPTLDFLLALPTDASGGTFLSAPWPVGFPPAFEIFFQFWQQDTGASFGWSASNAVLAVTP